MMKKTILAGAAVLAGMLVAGLAHGQTPTLKVGDKAPPLVGGEWVKGEPVSGIEEGKVYVLEYWATWCGPCIRAIPHVTEFRRSIRMWCSSGRTCGRTTRRK